MSSSAASRLPVLAERNGPVLLLTLNRPEIRNAFDLAMARCLETEIDRFEGDDELRVAIISGGSSFFCAGVDLRAAARGERPRTEGRGWFGLNEKPPEKPLIAAVEGPALAGGFELALACDLVVASRQSVFGLPEVARGLIASAGGLVRLPRKLPMAIAMELALIGEPVDAERLFALGLVNRLCDPGQALATALAMAQRIAANAPLSVAATRRVLLAGDSMTPAEVWRAQESEFERVRNSADYQEGIRAFAEKRRPVFHGK